MGTEDFVLLHAGIEWWRKVISAVDDEGAVLVMSFEGKQG